MCGRFALYADPGDLAEQFGAPLTFELAPRYNITPATPILAVGLGRDGAPGFSLLHWGLIPRWAKNRAIAARTFNARAESVADKPAFRDSFRQRRCLIPANGFFEWQRHGRERQPFFVQDRSAPLWSFAGLWDQWRDPATGARLASCTIIVTDANETLRGIHPRMPVVLAPESRARWLDPTTPPADLQALLHPWPAEQTLAHPVSHAVDRPDCDAPQLIAPLAGPEPPRIGDLFQ